MLQGVLQFTVRVLLKILSGAVVAGVGMRIFGRVAGKTLAVSSRAFLPVILFVYLRARKIKARLIQFFAPLRGHALYIFGHRYFVHALVVLIVLVVSMPSLRAADAINGTPGQDLPLRMLISENDEEGESVIDNTLPAPELESYLEGIFQNQQAEKNEATLPLTLDDGALLRQELPGTTVLPTRTEIAQYEVKPGDTIWGVAEEFGLSVTTVLWENNLTLYSTIRPGQKLTILPVSGVSHAVRKGETLGAISKRYGAALEEVISINKLADATASLAPGMKLIIPGGRPFQVATPATVARRNVITPPSSLETPPVGKLLWPTISRRITQYFTWRHAGLDVGDKTGNPIYAAADGVVEISGWGRGGWGNTVVVNHGGGLKTRYAHASKLLVSVGQQVSRGQVVALVGSTGRSTGPHLHLTIYVNGRPVNPLSYLR